jgi:hypothetical protein
MKWIDPSIECAAAWPKLVRRKVSNSADDIYEKVVVFDRAEARDVASDWYIPWRVGEYHLRALFSEQAPIAFRRESVAAENAVLAEKPEITQLGDRRGGF